MVDIQEEGLTPALLEAILENLKTRLARNESSPATGWAAPVKEAIRQDIENDIRIVKTAIRMRSAGAERAA